MRLRVIAQTEADYDAWVAAQQAPLARPPRPTVRRRRRTNDQVGLHRLPLDSSAEDDGATIGPNLTHVGDRTAFAGGIYAMNLDEPDEVGPRRAEPQAVRRPATRLHADVQRRGA